MVWDALAHIEDSGDRSQLGEPGGWVLGISDGIGIARGGGVDTTSPRLVHSWFPKNMWSEAIASAKSYRWCGAGPGHRFRWCRGSDRCLKLDRVLYCFVRVLPVVRLTPKFHPKGGDEWKNRKPLKLKARYPFLGIGRAQDRSFIGTAGMVVAVCASRVTGTGHNAKLPTNIA